MVDLGAFRIMATARTVQSFGIVVEACLELEGMAFSIIEVEIVDFIGTFIIVAVVSPTVMVLMDMGPLVVVITNGLKHSIGIKVTQ